MLRENPGVKAEAILFKLHDESAGHAVSPQRVPLAVLKSFADEVADVVRGEGSKADANRVEVAVVDGSLGLLTEPLADAVLFADLRRMTTSNRLDDIATRRRGVFERWQARARKSAAVRFEISSPALSSAVVISATTDFRAVAADQWVKVERYWQGEVEDLGGSDRVNAHIRLSSGERLMVDADRKLLRDDKVNRLYKTGMVRVSADYNVATKEHRNARLIEFVDYEPRFDEDEFRRMTEQGRQAWGDVTNASGWVESLRGHAE